jgi:hypothetical protein
MENESSLAWYDAVKSLQNNFHHRLILSPPPPSLFHLESGIPPLPPPPAEKFDCFHQSNFNIFQYECCLPLPQMAGVKNVRQAEFVNI